MPEENPSVWLAKKVCEGRTDFEKHLAPAARRTSLTEEDIGAVRAFSRVLPTTASCLTKHNVHILEKYMNFRSEKWFYFRTMLVPIQSSWLTKEKYCTTIDHPSYSSDLCPCDYHMFGPLKDALKGDDPAIMLLFKPSCAIGLKHTLILCTITVLKKNSQCVV